VSPIQQITVREWRDGSCSFAVGAVSAGTTVCLYVGAIGFAGQSLAVSIFEDDPVGDDFIASGTLSCSSTACTAIWTATWTGDGFGDPEYYFQFAGGNSGNLSVSR
jgi:hypothetical protein